MYKNISGGFIEVILSVFYAKPFFLEKIEKYRISLIIIRLRNNYSNVYKLYMTQKYTLSTSQSSSAFLDKSIGWSYHFFWGYLPI
jgi:hypothetical protein